MDTTLDNRSSAKLTHLGHWLGNPADLLREGASITDALHDVGLPLTAVHEHAGTALATGGTGTLGDTDDDGLPLVGFVPPSLPASLGDPTFKADHGLRYAYVAGSMANGIGSVEIVEAMGRAGMLGFFGAAGLALERVRDAIDRLQSELGDTPFGVNLIHSPNESALEEKLVDLFIEKKLKLIEASAFLQLTQAVVRYRLHGIHRNDAGDIVAPNRIIAKVSREEIAEKFFSPAPEKIFTKLLESGKITNEQAELAREIPVAQDITAEADSGGHTDHRPAVALLPTLTSLRDRLQTTFAYSSRLRVGLAGGIATPESAAAAFAMGAAYVMTGSVNQACVESGTSDDVREMLAETRQADVTRAPAADMFEMGVTVQVLKRGTMFSMRGAKLYELYRSCGSLEEIPAAEREKLEKTVFRNSLDEVWNQTRDFFLERDPRQVERAEQKPKHKMALVFRWYLGQSSNWANRGETDRKMDYQVWCGPAMGAFNEWASGTFLEEWKNRDAVTVARNILLGACVMSRVNNLRQQGIEPPSEAALIAPKTATELDALGIWSDQSKGSL